MFKCGISGVRKKNEIRDFYLLGSNPLVGLYVNLQVLRKKSKCFSERFEVKGCWKIMKLGILCSKREKKCLGCGLPR